MRIKRDLYAVKACSTNVEERSTVLVYALCDKGLIPDSKTLFMGIFGDPASSQDRMPFILTAAGIVDFGSGYDHDERFFETNFRSKRMSVGEFFTSKSSAASKESVYRIEEVTPLCVCG